jgi:hypothetical protein
VPPKFGSNCRLCPPCGRRFTHQREATDVYSAEFPSHCSRGDGGCDARLGANIGGRPDRRWSAWCRIDSGLYRRFALGLSLVRAARVRPRPDHQPVPLAGAAARTLGGSAALPVSTVGVSNYATTDLDGILNQILHSFEASHSQRVRRRNCRRRLPHSRKHRADNRR